MLSHRNLLAMTLCYFADVDRIAPGDAIAARGADVARLGPLHPAARARGPPARSCRRAAASIRPRSSSCWPAHARRHLFAAPTMVKRLAGDPLPRRSGRIRASRPSSTAARPMYLADLDRRTRVFGHRLAQIYGQGESPMSITALVKAARMPIPPTRAMRERLASVGTRAAGGRGAGRGRGRPAAAGGRDRRGAGARRQRDARLLARPRGDARRRCAAAGCTPATSASWIQDGFLTLRDRSKDLIISGGSNIYPREVEEVLLRHPAVAEVAVVGGPIRNGARSWSPSSCAQSGAERRRRRARRPCLAHIARFKRPKDYRFVDALPKNNYGKVLKTELRSWLDRA